jgi:hypothetical protein
MDLQLFNKEQLHILGEALDIAEDSTSNYFKLSQSHWSQHPFDVKTLSGLFGDDVRDNIFALLRRYVPGDDENNRVLRNQRELYVICVQDHQILKALQRDKELRLLPLLAYVLTHELVHIVRFCKFQVRYDTEEEASRDKEEDIVHHTTHEILKELPLSNLAYILGSYTPENMSLDHCMV